MKAQALQMNTTVTEDSYNNFLTILSNEYGLTDSLGGDPKDTNESLLVKLSWNINDDHRLDFTYQWQDDQRRNKVWHWR